MAIQKFPGFIDVHVHLRDPGATQKEDFNSGTRAAIAGGFTYLLDMPNNPTPTVSLERLEEKIRLVKEKAACDIGFHFGTDGNNLSTFAKAARNPHVFGLKIYCNHTTGTLLIEDTGRLNKVFGAWRFPKPILVHAEGNELEYALYLTKKYQRRLHVCHISLKEEVGLVRKAKAQGLSVTAGVTPHHLFLTEKDVQALGSFAIMKPPLGTKPDQDALWLGLGDGTIDLVESDHAPHTKEEKAIIPAPFGVPGLETTVGLMFKAVHEKRLVKKDVINLLYSQPKKIFSIPDQKDTYLELDPDQSFIAGENGYQTKCGWSPFNGWELYGRVETVIFKGKKVL